LRPDRALSARVVTGTGCRQVKTGARLGKA
jgi:hypothetical protein